MNKHNFNLNIHYTAPDEVWKKIVLVYTEMPTEEWNLWIELFKTKASKALGYEVGEPEEGFDFKYY